MPPLLLILLCHFAARYFLPLDKRVEIARMPYAIAFSPLRLLLCNAIAAFYYAAYACCFSPCRQATTALLMPTLNDIAAMMPIFADYVTLMLMMRQNTMSY